MNCGNSYIPQGNHIFYIINDYRDWTLITHPLTLIQKSGYFARSAKPGERDLDLIKKSAFMAVEFALKEKSGLVGLDDNAASLIHETALKTSMNNEKALWQKFQSKKGHDELAKEISAIE